MSADDGDDRLRPLPRERRGRRRPRSPNPEARRRLMESARELIWEVGVPELRVEEVATRAGLAVGTFYLYFESKTDLFVQLVMEHTEKLRERLRAAYGGGGSFAARSLRGLDAYLAFVEENEKGFLYFRDSGSIETNEGRLAAWAFRQHAEDLRPLLDEAIAAGEVRAEDPERLAQALLGLMQHMAGWWLEHREAIPRQEMTRFLGAMTWRGLQA